LFIPFGQALDAVDGDRVVARATPQGKREGKARYVGQIIEILERNLSEIIGILQGEGRDWYVIPDGDQFTAKIFIGDPSAKDAKKGDKVRVEILNYPSQRDMAVGVILEKIGRAGASSTELKSIILRYDLHESFSRSALGEARAAAARFEKQQESIAQLLQKSWREDIRSETIITIDPVDARDFDDAISLKRTAEGHWLLGVHIADVAAFVTPGTHLDDEAKQRGNSVYLPQHVVPMLPETLSNGICSLQEGRPRFAKSAYIELDAKGHPVHSRFANSLIQSSARLTYEDADDIIEGRPSKYPSKIVKFIKSMEELARVIEKRRQSQGMLTLQIPRAELVYDEKGHAVDAHPESRTFSHTLIEMFMLEANEAVGRLLDSLNIPFMRRIHAEPDSLAAGEAARVINLCGYTLPKKFDRHGIQQLLMHVADKPESFMINLAVLKSMQRAEYSPAPIGHFALASPQYCHFTSPIRRYPDLTIHRLLDIYITAKLTPDAEGVLDYDQLVELSQHCSHTERNAEDAERDLTEFKILQLLSGRLGSQTHGIVTAITNFGLFVQLDKFLIEGLIRAEDVPAVQMRQSKKVAKPSRSQQKKTAQKTGGKFSDTCPYKIGQKIDVKLAEINLATRSLTLVPV